MRITVTGASGLLGRAAVARLRERGDEVTVLSRDPGPARERLGSEAHAWQPLSEPAPAQALAGRHAVLHLAGENVAQRWTGGAKRAILESRTTGTANLVAGLRAADPRPRVLVSASAAGYYGPRGEAPLDEEAAPGRGFLAEVCVAWEHAATEAEQLGLRVARIRTGIVLDKDGGALQRMLPPFRAGLGGPVAGGRQYMPWIHRDDVVGIMLAAVDGEQWSGPLNASAPEPITNRQFSRTLGSVLGRPASTPIPAFALRLLYGEMAEIVTTGQRAVPARALVLGYEFRHRELAAALESALS